MGGGGYTSSTAVPAAMRATRSSWAPESDWGGAWGLAPPWKHLGAQVELPIDLTSKGGRGGGGKSSRVLASSFIQTKPK